MKDLTAVVLAAGQGTRMKGELTKVLHPLAGRPLVYFPIRAALEAGAERVVVVVGPGVVDTIEGRLRAAFPAVDLAIVVQPAPLGTGDAVRVGLSAVSSKEILILYGDTPLLLPDDVAKLVEALLSTNSASLALLTCVPRDPSGYGRILRDSAGRLTAIREHAELGNEVERAVREVNAGMYVARVEALGSALSRVRPDNAKGEYYLTDVVNLLAEAGSVATVGGAEQTLLGVNDRVQLARAEALMYERIANRHRLSGVTVRGDAFIEDSVTIEPDAIIGPGVSLRGETAVGKGALIDVGSVIDDCVIAAGAHVKPYSVMQQSRVGARAEIGPFAHLRPDSEIGEQAKIGNFVETKKTRMRRGAKASHLAYLGDADIGEGANLGAGTICCNYDGFSKHQTVVGEGAFVGSDSQLVAPVRVGARAYVASGTSVTQDVPDDALAIGRARQENKLGYATRLRERLAAQKRSKGG